MGNLTHEELIKSISANEIDTVIAVFPDYYGRLLGKRMTGRYYLENEHFFCCNYLLTSGMEMDTPPGFEMASWENGYGDYVFVPDNTSLRKIPWLPKTALVICDLQEENGDPVSQSPRSILNRQCERLANKSIKAFMGPELEFHLFSGNYSELQKNGYVNLEPSSPYRIDYHILSTTFDEPLMRDLRNFMSDADIPIECSKGECGNGQHEIGLYYAEAVEMADRHVIYKNGTKEIAAQHNAAITFMAKYDETQAGSSCHIHTSIFDSKSNTNLFWNQNEEKPSDYFCWFLGGLNLLAREFFLFFGPTVNSYKRYCSDSFAPTGIAWSHDNRTTGFRIVGHGQSFRIENRLPGADANPYLAFAATIAAGLYGVENKIECPDEFKGNAYADEKLPRVPENLSEAADLLDKSKIARKIFTDQVVDHYVLCARLEQESFHKAVTDWERFRYFERT